MRLSIWPSAAEPWESVCALATHAERNGWDGVYIADHFMPSRGDDRAPVNECWAYLAALAVAVPRLRLGSLVCGNTYRHPAVLANQAATVDGISGGRLVLGLGAGWQENEHTAYGIPFHTVKERLDMLEEACQVVKGLTTQERTTFSGTHYQLVDATMNPKPVQSPLPLLIGGGGEKRTLRIVARYADEWNCWGAPDVLTHKMSVLDAHCQEIGRDPSEIRRSAQALVLIDDDPDMVDALRRAPHPFPKVVGSVAEITDTFRAYAAAGVDEFIVPVQYFPPAQRQRLALLDLIRQAAAAAG